MTKQYKKFLSIIFYSLFTIHYSLAARTDDVPTTPTPAAPGPSESDTIPKLSATLRIMNKAAGKAKTITLSVGKASEYERMNILVRACRTSAPYSARDDFMFAEISKKSGNASPTIFSGWMMASDPGYNPLQDSDYDLWLIRCE